MCSNIRICTASGTIDLLASEAAIEPKSTHALEKSGIFGPEGAQERLHLRALVRGSGKVIGESTAREADSRLGVDTSGGSNSCDEWATALDY